MGAARDPFRLVGTTLAEKYRVVAPVGEGGFGVVYRGEHVGFEAPIAIKCLKLPPHFGEEEQALLIRGLRDEGRLLLQLSQKSASIVQALDVGSLTTPSGALVPYLVLEWLDGHTLADDLRRRVLAGTPPRSLREALALLAPAAEALALAHRAKVAHRDIKPENLFLVERDGRPSIKILDFGIAKVFEGTPAPSSEATQGLGAFTPSYGAPEQFTRTRGASGPWTDVYAFTLVLMEVLAQRRALEGDDVAALYERTTDPVRRPSLAALGVQAGPALEGVISRALAIDPDARLRDLGELWSALERAAAEGDEDLGSAATVLGGDLTVRADATDPGSASSRSSRARPERASAEARARTAPADKVAIPQPPPSRLGGTKGRRLAPALAIGAGAVAAAIWALRAPAPSSDLAPSAAASSAAPAGPSAAPSGARRSLRSDDPEIAPILREAERAWHDGDEQGAIDAVKRAAAKDSELGAAELRLALWQFDGALPQAREAFARATRLRQTLDEKDAALFVAAQSLFAQPWDLAALEASLSELVKRYPADVELGVYLGYAQKARLSFDAAIATFDRVIAADPELVPARMLRADALSMKGDLEGQVQTYRDCLAHSPSAVGCQEQLVLALSRAGRCDEMLREAKVFAGASAKSQSAHELLADALAATGAPPVSVLEAGRRGIALAPEERRRADELEQRAALAVLAGDFEPADEALAQWEKEVEARPDQFGHALPALRRARLFLERGEPKRAGQVASDVLARLDAWSEPSGGDLSMNLLPFVLRGGQLDADTYATRRDAWIGRVRAKWSASGRSTGVDFEWITWSNAWGNGVESETEAKAALAALPGGEPPALVTGRWPAMDFNLGRARLLAGDARGALAPLERVARSCMRLGEPTLHLRAMLALGLALEQTGDKARARAAFEEIVAAWGAAKPKSVTAEQAKRALARVK